MTSVHPLREADLMTTRRRLFGRAAERATDSEVTRLERVYWYTMWGGDNGQDTDFSLVKNPGYYPNYWKSPLFQVLTASP